VNRPEDLEDLPPEIDRRLRVRLAHCDAPHYLVGNSHTFRGRMSAWCVALGQEISISKSDVIDAPAEAQIWIDGFLRGNEAPPPILADSVPDEVVERMEADWDERRVRFRETGVWTESDDSNESSMR
jgi:hypothetical protein